MNNDLISRSALLKNKTRMTEYDESGCGVHVFVVKEEDVLDAPAVDAEVVRHGQNVTATHSSDLFVCSECGFSCEITEIRYEDGMGEPDAYEYDCKFCPNCGAKMDAGVQDGTE